MEKNLHRLVSDDAFELSIRDQPTELRAKSLIQREVSCVSRYGRLRQAYPILQTSKKVFWGLCREDWYACIWRSTFSQLRAAPPLTRVSN